MKLTRNGIAYDLTKSPYVLPFHYGHDDIVYVFSSELYKEKFFEKYTENRENISNSLSNRFGLHVENDILCDLVMYSKIEKRGFLIIHNGVNIECLNDITLDGKNLTIKS